MRKSKVISILFGIVFAASGIAVPNLAQAENPFDQRLALSFAPNDPLDDDRFDRFDQFDGHGEYEDAHELNDAWLGMPVRDSAGEVVGYVDDAFLDEEGYLTELLVSLNGSSVTVFIDQKHVEYTEVGVLVDLPVREIASLRRVGG